MSVADAKKKIDEDLKEFFAVRNLDEAEVYFTGLPAQFHVILIDKLVTKAVESKEADAKLVGNFFSRAVSKKLCTPAAFEEGFMPTAETIDIIAIDAPKAFQLFATMLKGAELVAAKRGPITTPSTALATAGSVQYPDASSPKPDLNENAKEGKLRYEFVSPDSKVIVTPMLFVAMTATSCPNSCPFARKSQLHFLLPMSLALSPSTKLL